MPWCARGSCSSLVLVQRRILCMRCGLSKCYLVWSSMSVWSQHMDWKYHLGIAANIPTFRPWDLAISGASNDGDACVQTPGETEIIDCVIPWTDVFRQLKKQLEGRSRWVIPSRTVEVPLRSACNSYMPKSCGLDANDRKLHPAANKTKQPHERRRVPSSVN